MENLVAWKKKYRKIKKEFDAIKNYPDKLNYWKTNLCSKESIYWDFIPRYFIQGDEQERLLPENQVCIFPEHSNDKELFCDWVFNLIEEDDRLKKHSFNKLKLAFNETIGKTPLPKEFILSELKEIEYQRDKEQKNFENKLQIKTWAYYYGYMSVVKGEKTWIDMDSELFLKLSLNISNGVADAYYYSFLQKELEKLEQLKYQNMKIEVKHDIETIELEKCIYLMGFWINGDSKVISEFLDEESDIDKKYVTPFDNELNKNLLRKDTREAKRDLIKYYIFQFIEIQGFLNIHKSIIQHKPDSKGDSLQRNTSEVKTDFEKYVIICSQYFDVFFNVIQLCCKNYNIDFFKACLELNFTLEFIDSGISLMFEEKRNENLLSQEAETKSTNTSNRSIAADIVDSLRAEVEMDELLLRAENIRKEKEGINLPPQKTDQENPQSNTETHTEKYLCEFEDAFNSKADYLKAIEIINSYFKGNEYKITVKIFVKNGYTKRLAFALGEIWRSEKNGTIPFEYLSIYKQLFTIFSKQRLEKEHVFSSPLYKYSITKT